LEPRGNIEIPFERYKLPVLPKLDDPGVLSKLYLGLSLASHHRTFDNELFAIYHSLGTLVLGQVSSVFWSHNSELN
jgi:hypothetical protein